MQLFNNRSTVKRYIFAALILLVALGIASTGSLVGTKSQDAAGFASLAPNVGAIPAGQGEQPTPAPVTTLANGGTTGFAVKNDVSPAVRDLPVVSTVADSNRPLRPEPGLPRIDSPALLKDPVLQDFFGSLAAPTPIASFEGIYNYWGVIPPDTVGDVGPAHYVQQVNVGFQIFSKTNGASLAGPFNFNDLYRGFGGLCETRNDGDPIVLYDQIADRWLLSQFTAPPGPYFQCVAISVTGDPTGAYHRYAFQTNIVNFDDYPHYGVWPDAYYISTNQFANGVAFAGAGFIALERNRMVNGEPAQFIAFNRPPPDGGFLPTDLDGYRLPPAGAPNFFMAPNRILGNAVRQYKFDIISWNPPLANLVGPADIPVAAFDTSAPGVPQPGTAVRLDTITDRFMNRLAYRNMGTHESLVVNHTVDPGGERAGVRWYEFRSPDTAPLVFQQGTFAPADGLSRWMGSIAMDAQGNMGLGYSTGSSTLFPSIRYTGRLVTDPPGTMDQNETTLIAGGGSQTETIAGRWGDYSSMNVDADDCTFWYTTEYYSTTGLRNWRTRIGSFKFPTCNGAIMTPTAGVGTPRPSVTPSVTPLASATPCAGAQTIVGQLTTSDSSQTGRLARTGVVSTCAMPKPVPALGDGVVRNYDAYTYTNSSSFNQCVTVSVVNNCTNNALLSAAYLGSFNPNNVQENYLADMGASGPRFTYSFNVPANATYVVTVLENSGGVGCASYTLSVNQCSVGTAIPTNTGTPPTATATRTTVVTASATATPCGQVSFTEGFESGTLGIFSATTTLGTSPWVAVNTGANTGTFAALGPDPDEASDQQMTQRDAVPIPTMATSAQLRFAHRYSFEDATVPYDGGVLEYSTDNGATWVDAGPLITQGGYTGVIIVGGGNPLQLRPAWVNVSPGYPAYTQVVVNLNSLRGQSGKIRFREGSDSNTGAPGWNVDDVTFVVQLGCQTGTVGPTNTPGGPTNTAVIPSNTVPVPTNTTVVNPSNTIAVPSSTTGPGVTPSSTMPIVPSNTVVVPTNTTGPGITPSSTMPVGPSNTPGGPTNTAAPVASNTTVATIAPTITGTPPTATATPSTLYGLTISNRLVKFNSDNPQTILGDVPITGLQSGEQVQGIDFRPATGQLYGLGSTSRLYTINPNTGAAAQVGTGVLSPTLQGAEFGFDFNPVVDRIRIVSDQRQNLRVHPDTLAVTVDGTLTYTSTDPNATAIPNVVSAAYTNNFSGTASTTLYDIDTNGFRLVRQDPPNNGTLNTVGSLNLGVGANSFVGFDIVGANTAYATFNTVPISPQGGTAQLYRINLGTGTAIIVGTVGNGLELKGLAAGPGGATAVTPTATAPVVAVPTATLYAVTASNRLLRFQAGNPQVIEANVQITGVFTNERILGIDFRPANGQLYGLGSTSRLYTINPATGAAAQVGTGVLSPTLQGLEFGFDFNPVVDRIRIVSDQRQNLRVHPDTLAVTVDGTLTYTSTDPNGNAIPNVVGAAYTNNFAGAASTTLYDIDTNGYNLLTQNPPNNGTLNTVGPLGVTTEAFVGFDIVGAGTAFAAFRTVENAPAGGGSRLYTVNLGTGAATLVGLIGTGSEDVRGLTGAPSQTGVTPTPTVCPLQFTDVPPTNTFYTFVRCLACRGILGGYSDGTFRPNNQVTRGQLSKIVSNSAGFSEPAGAQIFEDVPTSNPFYEWINRLSRRGIMGGYPCGSPGEPCVAPGNRPYFRPFANATRGQISKIVSNAAGFAEPQTGQTFSDVPTDNPFHLWIERLATRGIMGGYPCGSPVEPCDAQNRPYFRWANDSTRGQTAKIVAGAFFPNCQTPANR